MANPPVLYIQDLYLFKYIIRMARNCSRQEICELFVNSLETGTRSYGRSGRRSLTSFMTRLVPRRDAPRAR